MFKAYSLVIVHPSYADALNLQNAVVGSLDEGVPLQKAGLLIDLPDAISLDEYQETLRTLEQDLQTLPIGDEHAEGYELIVGSMMKLCFFRALTNVEHREADYEGRVVRDWIAANVAAGGFWEMVRQRYQATQVIWECKNYADLSADDFHQAAYYMGPAIGGFVVVAFRGEIKKHYYSHIRRISSDKHGLVLLMTDQDLKVFIRQARNGKVKENHIQEIYDRTVRAIS